MLISLNIRDKENTVRQLETWAEKKEIIIKIMSDEMVVAICSNNESLV